MNADDLDIRGGGAVSVDSATLIDAAEGFGGVARELDDVATVLDSAAVLMARLPREAWELCADVARVAEGVREVAARADAFDRDLRESAAVYDLVELRAQSVAAAAAGDDVRVAALAAAAAALEIAYPGIGHRAEAIELGAELSWPAALAGQAGWGSWWPFAGAIPGGDVFAAGSVYALAQVVRRVGAGTIPAGTRLVPQPTEVRVGAVHRSTPAAPASLVDIASRVPGGGDARVRVERYSMPDGSRQFVLYVAGTQTPAGMGGEDPFDGLSNLQLYGGVESASYDAAVEALRLSGAQPGDVVHQVGHSQGAMVTAHVALQGGFDTQTLISFGSPVEVDLDDVLTVSVAHTDDPVAALQGGGHTQAVGAPGSFVAEREADPSGGWHDLALPAHAMASYEETARMLDASADPRMDRVRDLLRDLASATAVQATDYSAERVLPVPAPSPGPAPFGAGVSPGGRSSGGGE